MKDNKLIAEFMGEYTPYEKFGDNTEYYYKGKYVKLENMEFHKSWDWLMPVVEKIEQVNEGVPQQMLHVNLYSEKREVYQAVIEFIKEYNK